MQMYTKKSTQITEVIEDYFNGIYEGNIVMLRQCFAQDAQLYGDINGDSFQKSLDDYLEGVSNRQSPKELNESFQMEIISIEIIGHIAVAKLHLPMMGFNYYDLLSFHFDGEDWKIVNKLFTHVA